MFDKKREKFLNRWIYNPLQPQANFVPTHTHTAFFSHFEKIFCVPIFKLRQTFCRAKKYIWKTSEKRHLSVKFVFTCCMLSAVIQFSNNGLTAHKVDIIIMVYACVTYQVYYYYIAEQNMLFSDSVSMKEGVWWW